MISIVESVKVRLGKNVRRYRDKIGLSQSALAEAVNLSEASIGLLERGKVWPEYDNLKLIAERLGVSETVLFQGPIEYPPPSPEEALRVLTKIVSERHK